MNRSILLILFAILISGISTSVYAQTISDHVVINEIDTNPFGDDSQSISEWVELYNPTDSNVDLSGWEIASTTVLKKTFTISDGTIISPGGFLAYTYEKIWFTDSSELVELRNADGVIIDTTPFIVDLENDFSSWQRSYDGFSDWEFSLASAGSSNGKFIEFLNNSPVGVTVSSDKTSYQFGDTAIIEGTVSEKIYAEITVFQVASSSVTISGPNFDHAVSLYPDYNLNYETTLSLVQVLGIGEGIYDVSVIYDGVVSETTFSVNSEVIEEIQEETVSPLIVMTGKSEYLPGQFVSITGVTSEIILYESLQFTITDSIGDLVANGNLFTSDGQFETSIFLTTVNPNYGVYTIDVEYADNVASTTFNVVEDFIDEPVIVLDSIILDTDKSEYLLNDFMTLSGTITNFDPDSDIYYQVVYFTFKNSDGIVPNFTALTKETSASTGAVVEFKLTAIPDRSGIFSIDARIPPVIFSEGDYTVKANYGGLIANESFSIIAGTPSTGENPSTGNPNVSIPGKPVITDDNFENGYFTFNIKTIIEKVNRISDNLISISTQNKIIDEQSVKPRVVSGSMITMSKDNQSNVNLRVVSESGICIIGSTDECLVSESTRKPGQIFDVVEVDGLNLNVRYTGPDVRLEKFSILPESSDEFLPDTNWNVEVIKDNEISRMYYKVTYKTLQ